MLLMKQILSCTNKSEISPFGNLRPMHIVITIYATS